MGLQFSCPVYVFWFHEGSQLEVLSRLDPDGSHFILTENGWDMAGGPLNPEETTLGVINWDFEYIRKLLYEFHAHEPANKTFQVQNILTWMLNV